MVVAIIPARYASTRLPGKPLIDLCGQSMLERVWRAATMATLIDHVLIATDDDRVVAEARRIGADVCLTRPSCSSGTDRCYDALNHLTTAPTLVVNIQGDEPLLEGATLDSVVSAALTSGCDVTTLVRAIQDPSDLVNPNVVKVVRGTSGNALYFSRSAVPFNRDVAPSDWLLHSTYWQHIGLYAYTPQALHLHVSLPPSHLEQVEGLEQLRLLEKGASFHCVETTAFLRAVDTALDAEEVRKILLART